MTTSPAAPAATCAVCAQTLHAEVNAVTGATQLVADDGWGTICGDAPEGEHVPAPAECEHGLSADLCMGPDHYPSREWEMEREFFADDVSERFAGEAIPADYFDDEPWAWDEETGQPAEPAPFVSPEDERRELALSCCDHAWETGGQAHSGSCPIFDDVPF